jgi:hypothetical protein
MLFMILKMSGITLAITILTVLLWIYLRDKKITWSIRILLAAVYAGCAILSTHYGVDYSHMLINVRDMGPLCAGLFFDPLAGIIAGVIGGIERYIAGAYWGIGSYTKVACSVSTGLSGFVAAFMSIFIFKRKKPSATYAFFMGAVMEVFHMYVVFVTHRDDLKMAFYVVKACAPPMIIFTGIGLALCANALKIYAGEWKNPFKRRKDSEIQVAQKFQRWLFLVSAIIIVVSFAFSFAVQTASAVQNTTERLATASADIIETYNEVREKNYNINVLHSHVGETGDFNILRESGLSITGGHKGDNLSDSELAALQTNVDKGMYRATAYGVDSFCRADTLANGEILLVSLPSEEVYDDRDAASYETALADIILFTVIYVLISMLVQEIVVNNLDLVNESLNKITNGDLNETVDVYNSSEFASLSDDINQTVNVLKGYIDAAEKRIAQELEFAKSIQESALPQNFHIPRKDVEIFATMDPAKEVGGDFYDFFFIDADNMVLVIADVSGKGIPASLFMMRSKAAIRSTAVQGSNPSDILEKVNEVLCEGNDADMFVTVWIGIMNLKTGVMRCSNAGHEYPIIRHKDGDYELLKDKHFLALATIEGIKFKDYEIDLKYGDEIFVYTDGIPEAIDKDIKQYGTERLLSALNANKDIPLDRLLPRVRNDLAQFVGEADQFDDVTMLGFKYKDPVA